MNNFLKVKKNKSAFGKLLKGNYGYGSKFHFINSFKMNLSFDSSKKQIQDNFIEKNYKFYNRLLKLKKKTKIEFIKKQSSWRGLRFRQGLPVNGQRTHTNARTAKKLVPSASHFLI